MGEVIAAFNELQAQQRKYEADLRLRDTIVSQLGRYVPKRVTESIIRDQRALDPKRTNATVLFTDIENFTSLSEAMSPEQVFAMLNEYFSAIVEPIVRHNGVVNQFQGDAMLVTFNVPVEDDRHADQAVEAAREIQGLTPESGFAGVKLRTRIGINTGEVIAGNVGAGTRYNYTVHGDAVNSAARLEQLNKDFETHTLVAESTVHLLTDKRGLVPMGTARMRGKREPVQIYRLDVVAGELN